MPNVKPLSNVRIFAIAAAIAIAALAGAAYAAPGRGGGGGGGRGGGGGGGGGVPHAMGGGGGMRMGGGGGMRVGGGGGMHFSAAPRAVAGPRFGGAPRFAGAPRYAGRPAISHFAARPSFRGQRSFAVRGRASRAAGNAAALRANAATNRNAISRNAAITRNANASIGPARTATVKSNAVRNALSSRSVAGALHNGAALRNPNARAHILASAATAGWHEGRDGHGWWRHRHGGFGWVGPLFWPLAYYDIYDYTLWGYGYDPLFWDYGYNDIYAGVFAPYGYDDLIGYLPPGSVGPRVTVGRAPGGSAAAPDELAQLCGDDSREIAGLPIDQIQQVIQPNDAERAALDELANASVKAARDIKAACPTEISLTAPGRLAAMQQRIEAMISAVDTVRPALQKFYDLLNDEQRARLNALAQDKRKAEIARNSNGSLVKAAELHKRVCRTGRRLKSKQGFTRLRRNARASRRCSRSAQRRRIRSRPPALPRSRSRRRRGSRR